MKKTKIGLVFIVLGLMIINFPLYIKANDGNTIYSITQITNNIYDDNGAQIHNGFVTWNAYDGNDHEIYLYDHSSQTTIQITDNGLTDVSPHIHNEQVVWSGYDGSDFEIFLYDFASQLTTQITDNIERDDGPSSFHNGFVTWSAHDGNDYENFIYDPNTGIITQITDNDYWDNPPKLHDGLVTWSGGDDTYDIFLYDYYTQVTTQITDNTYRDYSPTIHNGLITWFGYHGGLAEIFLYDYTTGTTSQITNDYNTDYYPQIHNGQITWGKSDGGIDIFFYDLASDTTVRITDDSIHAYWPNIHNGQVTWQQMDDGHWDIFLYDFSSDTIIQINDDSLDDNAPVIHDGMVTWWGFDGSDYELFIAAPSNTPPTIDSVTGPLDPVSIGDSVQITVDFTDPDESDTHVAIFEWGDEEIDVINVVPGERTISYDHIYTVPGVYTVALTISDAEDESDSPIYQYVVVYDPEGGFVTGGGWIDSPEGAYPADMDLTGKANFGFVSKYKKGTSVPAGNTEFQFNAGDLNFHSVSYDWLIIAGSKAKFKGSGTINGEGNYGFMLTGIDGDLGRGIDKFKIKIWDNDNDDLVIYDNAIGDDNGETEIGGGNIKIHLPN